MAIVVDAGTFASGTTTGDRAAQTPSLGGATPQLILFAGAGVDAAGGDAYLSFGAATGTTERAAVTFDAEGGATTTNVAHDLVTDACWIELANAGTLEGAVDLAAVAANSFTPTIDTAFAESRTVGWLAFAGFDGVSVGTLLLDADGPTGTDSVTGLSFQPDGVILFGYQTTVGTIEAGGEWSFGWSDGTNHRWWGMNSEDNVADTNTSTVLSNTRVWGSTNVSTGGTPNHGTVAMTADGFTVTRTGGTVDRNIGYVAWKGGRIKMIDTAFNGTAVTGAGFTPIAGLFMHSAPLTAYNSGAPGVVHAQGGIGWAVTQGKRFSTWIADEDALGTSDPHAVQSTAALAIQYDKETGATQDGGQDFVSWDSDGYTMIADDAAAGNYMIASLVFGQAASGSGEAQTSTSLRQALLRRRRANGRRR